MAREEILEKLQKELNREIRDECQVIYILSRIRKILEISDERSKYKMLNFYCNWALHAKIDRTEPVGNEFRTFLSNPKDENFVYLKYLHTELVEFFTNYKLEAKNFFEKANYLRFMNLIVDICADTPVEVYSEEKSIIKMSRPEHGKSHKNSVFEVEYTIS